MWDCQGALTPWWDGGWGGASQGRSLGLGVSFYWTGWTDYLQSPLRLPCSPAPRPAAGPEHEALGLWLAQTTAPGLC